MCLSAGVTPRTPWTGWTGGCSRAARWECRWPSTIATPPGELTTAEEGGRGPPPETGGGTGAGAGAGPGAGPGATTDTGAGSREAEADRVQSPDQDQETKNIASRSISTYTGNVMVTLPNTSLLAIAPTLEPFISFIHSNKQTWPKLQDNQETIDEESWNVDKFIKMRTVIHTSNNCGLFCLTIQMWIYTANNILYIRENLCFQTKRKLIMSRYGRGIPRDVKG